MDHLEPGDRLPGLQAAQGLLLDRLDHLANQRGREHDLGDLLRVMVLGSRSAACCDNSVTGLTG